MKKLVFLQVSKILTIEKSKIMNKKKNLVKFGTLFVFFGMENVWADGGDNWCTTWYEDSLKDLNQWCQNRKSSDSKSCALFMRGCLLGRMFALRCKCSVMDTGKVAIEEHCTNVYTDFQNQSSITLENTRENYCVIAKP